MAAIPLVIITLDLVVTPLVVSTIMKGKPFQFQFQRVRAVKIIVLVMTYFEEIETAPTLQR